jgi:predicted amidophosphoribosyltransferase
LLLVGLSEFIEENVIRVYNRIPFDKVISVPSNRAGHSSLPDALGRRLCELHPQLTYIEEPLLKTRAAETMKDVPKERRPLSVKGLYRASPSLNNLDAKGILVIDDVFETGSTLNSVCDAVATSFEGLKIFVVTITDLRAGR